MNRLLTIVDTKYQRLEYLESSGTQYIDTGIQNNDNNTIYAEFILEENGSPTICGGDNGNGGYYSNSISALSNTSFRTLKTNAKVDISSITTGVKHSIKISNDNVVYDGNTINWSSDSGNNIVTQIYLFRSRYGALLKYGIIKLCKYTIWNSNNVKVRDFVPVLRKTDNELGMLDLVEGKFYPNAGTGKFTANLDTMYAIIQGSPTQSPYGVFSGFSASNYLSSNFVINSENNDNFEFFVKFKTPTNLDTSGNYPILSIGNFSYPTGISVYKGTSLAFLNVFNLTDYSANRALDTDTWYMLKVSITSSSQSFILYNNDGTEKTHYSGNRAISGNDVLNFGKSNTNLYIGSIDLPNSYIKLGSTKYKLQAVVGYTVVGSLTESPSGVFSGFSSANYLKINVPTAIDYNVFELNIKFKTSDSSVYQRLIWNLNNLLFVMTGGSLSLKFYNTSNNWTSRSAGAIQNNTWYWYKIKFDIVNKTMIADRSTDGINFTNVLSSQNISNIYSGIKITTNGIIFCDQDNSGNITLDLNSTNIKINNKLWFNGQQA